MNCYRKLENLCQHWININIVFNFLFHMYVIIVSPISTMFWLHLIHHHENIDIVMLVLQSTMLFVIFFVPFQQCLTCDFLQLKVNCHINNLFISLVKWVAQRWPYSGSIFFFSGNGNNTMVAPNMHNLHQQETIQKRIMQFFDTNC